jgi:hypothetical protein
MTIDGLSLIGKVVERAIGKSIEHSNLAGINLSEPAREEVLVEMLASQLLALFGVRTPGGTARSNEESLFDYLTVRNALVSRALGACECWGERPDCPQCEGLGLPGWTMPGKAEFDQVVRPALRTIMEHRERVLQPVEATFRWRK